MKKIIIMIGPPGSGKGTQAKKIATTYNYAHISTGDMLRSLVTQSNLTDDEKQAAEQIRSGQLVADDLIYRLIFDRIEKEVVSGWGVVLDGVPRNLDQAKRMQGFFVEKNFVSEVLVLEITLSDEEAFKRLSTRRVCGQCGEIVPAGGSGPVLVCPKCSGELVIRADDNAEVVKQRIEKQGNAALAPIVNFYKELGMLSVVDGSQGIKEVEKDINQQLTTNN